MQNTNSTPANELGAIKRVNLGARARGKSEEKAKEWGNLFSSRIKLGLCCVASACFCVCVKGKNLEALPRKL